MNNKKNIFMAVFFISMFFVSLGKAWAVTELPDPDMQIPGAAPGETVAFLHDDFYAYSARLNTALGYAGFDISTGTGGLDLLIYTGAQGQDNTPVSGGFNFQDPLHAPGGNATSFSGIWGVGGASVSGPVTVDNLLSYLHANFGPNINVPVFDFDMNQGGHEDIYIAGEVSIWDPTANGGLGGKVAAWALDGIPNNQFDAPDPNNLSDPAWVKANGLEAVESATTGFSPPLYVFNNNAGSGHLDYIGVAPSMDLSQYTGHGYLFRGDFRLAGLKGGFEELYLTGRFAPSQTVIPEPTSIFLLGVGLAGLGRLRRKAN